jgi:hypothetical protein
MREFEEKSDIWLFRKGHVDFLFADLFKLKDFVKNHCPAIPNRKKTAIVVETKIQFGLAKSYAIMGRDLPCRIKVFTEFKDAEEWARGSTTSYMASGLNLSASAGLKR